MNNNEAISFKLTGVEEVINALDALNSKDTIKIIKTVERKSLSENIVKPLRAALPYSAKSKKSIRIVADKTDPLAFFAGITSDAFYLRFVEKGTKERIGRGKINPKPFAIPFIETTPQPIVDFFNKDFGAEVEKILKRKLKKLNK